MRKFVRTRPAPPAAVPPAPTPKPPSDPARPAHHYHNGHANGGGGLRRDDHHSTLSRYWSGSEGGRGGGLAAGGGGALWEDPEFPPARALPSKRRQPPLLWLRPYDLCSRPTFRGQADVGGGGAPHDDTDEEIAIRWRADVGAVGSAGLCCAAAALAPTPRLLDRVAPPQSFATRYTGAFRFNFWVFGVWREVVVDDRLPTRGGRPLYSRGSIQGDFTLPLLEKAYAKLYGSYAAMRVGDCAARALQELSGGVVQSFPLCVQPPPLVFQVLNSAVPRSTLIVATPSDAKNKTPYGHPLPSGLLAGQPYLVSGLARVRADSAAGGEALVLVRAVTGVGIGGAEWAAGGARWRLLPSHDQDLLAARLTHPGDFWMSFGEFARSFWSLELVHVGPDDWLTERALRQRRPWRAVLARRRWLPGHNAGGPPTHTETHSTNPQFHVAVEGEAARKCHVVVSVTQQYSPGGGARLRPVGFAVYELGAGAAPRRPLTALHTLRALDVTHESTAREVATFFTLPPGHYLVVPHCRLPPPPAFLLRLLTDDHTTVWEVNEDNMIIRDVAAEFTEDAQLLPVEVRAIIGKIITKIGDEEVDAEGLRAVLRAGAARRVVGGAGGGVSLALCRALVALADARMAGRVGARALPPLLARLWAWRQAFLPLAVTGPVCRAPRAPAHRLRALLAAAGVAASNKVLECVVIRYAARGVLLLDSFMLALARLHLAHERYRALESKVKSNPLSLEEMILMTIYS